jgi:hypothetical protein
MFATPPTANGMVPIADSAQPGGFSWAELMTDGVYRQALNNGGFQINQRALAAYTAATSPANSDDTYLLDMWTLLSDGNDIVDVSPEATIVPAANSIKFEVETANKKFGIIQFIENKDAIKYRSKTASLQFKAYTVTGKVIRNLRAAVLAWASTADTLTSDVVASWEAEGTNPTLAANWTAENLAANLVLVADTWTTYKIENIVIDTANMTNLAVFIWCDDADASVDDLIYIAHVQLNQGPVCLPWLPRPFIEDLMKCKRFFESSYPYGTAPGTANTAAGLCTLFAASEAACYYCARGFGASKPIACTITIYSYAGTINRVTDQGIGDVGINGCVCGNAERDGVRAISDSGSPFTPGGFYRCHWVASAEL